MRILAEHEAKKFLAKYGLPVTKFNVVEDQEDLDEIELRYPLALKVSSPKILHKTMNNAIVLDIRNKEELLNEFEKMKKRFPKEKFIVEGMEKRGVEIITGILDDKAFGKCIMIGMGGIFTEIYKDVSFRMLPIEKNDIESMLRDLKAYAIFEKLDKKILEEIVLKISEIALKHEVKQLDLNPIFLYEGGAKIIDAKIIFGG